VILSWLLVGLSGWALEQGADARRKFEQQDVFVPWFVVGVVDRMLVSLEFHSTLGSCRHLGKQFLCTGGAESDDVGLLQSAASQLHSKHGVAVDEQRQSVVLQRYCHVFTQGEIEELWASLDPGTRCSIGAAEVSVEETFFDAGNWCVRVRKCQRA
jgi:hypothetical protein